MTTISSREINQDFGRAKKVASKDPVIITDRGKPTHVLLNIEEYRRLSDSAESVTDALSSDDTVNLDDYIPERSFPSRKVIFD
jgi:prevent-host-death family protein